MIQRTSFFQDIVFRNEDNINLRIVDRLATRFADVRHEQGGMQACALDAGILVLSLHFDVVESACSVFGKHVEDDAPPLEILDIFLRSDIRDLEVGSAENDLDEQRRSFEAVAENFAHEGIVNEAEPLDFLPVFFFALCVVHVFPLLACRLAGLRTASVPVCAPWRNAWQAPRKACTKFAATKKGSRARSRGKNVKPELGQPVWLACSAHMPDHMPDHMPSRNGERSVAQERDPRRCRHRERP